MHPLLLALALGQAGPAVPPPEPPPAASPAPPSVPPPAPATLPATSPAAAMPVETPASAPPRPVELARNPDGSFLATLDGEPVRGAAFYRAVLRPDLAARHEEAAGDRAALLIAAAVAPVAGLGIGWVAGTAQQWPLPPCVGVPPGPVSCSAHDQVEAKNDAAMNTALLAGGIGGLATGLVLWLAGASIHPVEPTPDEVEALVRAYRARGAPATPPAPAQAAPAAGDASLRLETGPGAARLAVVLRF